MPRHARCLLIAAGLLWSRAACAETVGKADITFQGYYQRNAGQALSDTSGFAFRFRQFFPKAGLLSGSLENYGQQGRFRTGDNYLQLQGFSWGGWRWSVTGGDFRTTPNLVEFPFYNVYYPEIAARGFRLEASRSGRRYSLYAGQETLLQGPRVPFRVRVPQSILGATMQQSFGRQLQIGARFLRMTSDSASMEQNPFLFPLGRRFREVNTAALQSLYSPALPLKFYAEASASAAQNQDSPGPAPALRPSSVVGSVWDSDRFTARANYSYQSASYLPTLGYFLGDRRGPFAEVRVRPVQPLDLFGSASRYENNLEHRASQPTFRSAAQTGGATARLPWRFNANAQLSVIRFASSATASQAAQDSYHRQVTANLSRPIRRHSVRFSVREAKMVSNLRLERQRSAEVEDVFQFKQVVLGGAVRYQRLAAEERRHTLFFRGLGQLRLGRLTAYANFETGNDLVNRTLFATNTYSSTVIGVGGQVARGWQAQVEVFRNRLLTELNPENVFLFGNRGVAVPTLLSSFNQWNLFFRLTKELHWGADLPAFDPNIGRYITEQIPLVGVVQGFVWEHRRSGHQPAEGVAVSLDDLHTVTTDAAGSFRFPEVPEGAHEVKLALRELPADYNPGPVTSLKVWVKPKQTTRAELAVIRLSGLQGRVASGGGTSPENRIVRLLPVQLYTTTDSEGRFSFENLPEGDYELVLDETSLPERYVLRAPARVSVALRIGVATPPVAFEFAVLPEPPKPVRRILEQPLLPPNR